MFLYSTRKCSCSIGWASERSSGMRARLNDDVPYLKKNERIQKRRIQDFHRLHLENARVALVGRASEVLECARV